MANGYVPRFMQPPPGMPHPLGRPPFPLGPQRAPSTDPSALFAPPRQMDLYWGQIHLPSSLRRGRPSVPFPMTGRISFSRLSLVSTRPSRGGYVVFGGAYRDDT